jgi:hypothetical protein
LDAFDLVEGEVQLAQLGALAEPLHAPDGIVVQVQRHSACGRLS